jgi:thiol:disulfide interchange protein DsbD
MVQADITQNTKESAALLKRFGLFAPPSLVFFNHSGEQEKSLTVMGEISADTLLKKIALLR